MQHYRELAAELIGIDVLPVIIGGPDEVALAAEIADGTGAKSIAGETSFMDIAELSRAAAAAIGNDTGPMHIAAVTGCPSVVLFSKESDPSITAPRGDDVQVLRREKLGDLPVSEVADALSLR
jgi:ADP-heptose:LPS heptosyltransferase